MTRPHDPRPGRLRRRIAGLGLVVYGAVVLFATLLPNPDSSAFETRILKFLDRLYQRGVPVWVDFHTLEFGANVAMFVPLGICVGLLLSRRKQWAGIFILPVISLAIELAQYWFLVNRLATVSDVIANSIGGWVGVAIVWIARALARTLIQRDNARRSAAGRRSARAQDTMGP